MSPNTPSKSGLLKRITERAKKLVRRGPRPARRQDGYPKTGTGIRQGARLARQARFWLLDFTASGRCIERINARVPK